VVETPVLIEAGGQMAYLPSCHQTSLRMRIQIEGKDGERGNHTDV
jgi:hypothetical protein